MENSNLNKTPNEPKGCNLNTIFDILFCRPTKISEIDDEHYDVGSMDNRSNLSQTHETQTHSYEPNVKSQLLLYTNNFTFSQMDFLLF